MAERENSKKWTSSSLPYYLFYAKISPMSWDIYGHNWAENMLHEHILRGMVRHAYLISGPQGTGRRTLALRFSKALNCLKPPEPGEFCGICRACLQIERMQFSDLSLVQPEEGSDSIKVDQVRALQHMLALAPYEGKYRIALLLGFQAANPNAQNALLKTLEEPNPRVVLLLTADSPESLLPTIVSRCEVLRLRPMHLEDEEKALTIHHGYPQDEAHFLAHISSGRLGLAIRLHEQSELIEQINGRIDDLVNLLGSSRRERFKYVEILYRHASRTTFIEILETWLLFWRDSYFTALQADIPVIYLKFQAEARWVADSLNAQSIHHQISSLEQTISQMENTQVNTRLAMETLLLDMPRLSQ
jgi:DNA polymerase III subunit delta'